MYRFMAGAVGGLALCLWSAGAAGGAFQVNGPTTEWTPVTFGGTYPDPAGDQQTGSAEGDIIGNKANPCFYTAFDGVTSVIGFRIRISEEKVPPSYGECAFVGLDFGPNGKLELFVGVDNTGAGGRLGIWGAGTGANTSPSTTTIANTPLFSYAETALNYSWLTVSSQSDPSATTNDLDGGGLVDRFLSFSVPFKDVVTAASTLGFGPIDQSTVLGYVVATATQPNSLNQDIAGITGGVNSGGSWLTLGGESDPMRPDTATIPEPGTLLVAISGAILFLGRKCWRIAA